MGFAWSSLGPEYHVREWLALLENPQRCHLTRFFFMHAQTGVRPLSSS